MPITVVCQGIVRFDKETNQYVRCGTEIRVPETAAGKSVRCPTCGDDVSVPKTAPAAASPSAPAARFAPPPLQPSAPPSPAPPSAPQTAAPFSVGVAAANPATPWTASAGTYSSSPGNVSSGDASPREDAPIWLPSEHQESSSPQPTARDASAELRTPNPFAAQPQPAEDVDDYYRISPVDESPRPSGAAHPLAADGVYQLGESDEAPEKAVHSGWCDRCGHDIPDTLTICPKCGYQHGMAHVVLRKDPVLPPSMQVCPSCERQLPPGTLLCEACGYHSGLKQHFPALAKLQGPIDQPPPTGLDQWVSRQIEGGPSPKNAMLWLIGGIGVFVALGLLCLAGILFMILGPWALCLLVPVVAIVVVVAAVTFAKMNDAKRDVAKKRQGVEAAIWNLMLFLLRASGWRTPAPPFTAYRSLDVRNTGFSDNDLGGMQNRNDFEALDFEGTQVTDACLPYMASMPRLKFVCVRRSRVSEQGAWNLQRAKPDLWLWY